MHRFVTQPSPVRFVSLAMAAAVTAGIAFAAHADPAAPAATPAPIRAPAVQYDLLSRALERYKTLAATGGWESLSPGPTLDLGVAGPRVAALKRRLAIEGDLERAQSSGDTFDGALAAAVRRFQERTGLAGDGRVGAKTLAALNVSADSRVAQIAANLERRRHLPTAVPANRLEINVPAAELTILEADEAIVRMRVVVGARRFPTPLLQSRIVAVVFNPPWNVPTRIVRNEIIPRLRRQPAYLRDNDIRIVGRPDDPYGERIDWRNPRAVPPVQLQQQPGPKNALGRIKFDIPNEYSVYLHDTPAKSAFALPDRTLSHGCVRLQYPADVARYVLRAETQKDPDLIDRLLADSDTVSVRASMPLPVVFVYWTAFVDEDGRLNFRNDIYGHDAGPGAQAFVMSRSGRSAIASTGGCTAG